MRNAVLEATCEKARPVGDKFVEIFSGQGKSAETVTIYQCFHVLLVPWNVRALVGGGQYVDSLLALVPYLRTLNTATDHSPHPFKDQLMQEAPVYVERATGAEPGDEDQILRWWATHKAALPAWYQVFTQCVLLHPNSAAAERVFSLYRWMFSEQQEGALEDYKEASLMMRYNALYRAREYVQWV